MISIAGGLARRHPGASAQGGFSLPQLAAAIVILAVVGFLGVAKLSSFLRQKTLQGEAQGMLGLMRQSRSLGLKKNVPVNVIFDRSRNCLRIFEDSDGNGAWQSGEPVREVAMARGLAFGPASRPPERDPEGGTVPREGLSGTWTAALVFARDPMVTPSAGAAYLHHENLERWTACLIKPAGSGQVQAYLWDGDAWRPL